MKYIPVKIKDSTPFNELPIIKVIIEIRDRNGQLLGSEEAWGAVAKTDNKIYLLTNLSLLPYTPTWGVELPYTDSNIIDFSLITGYAQTIDLQLNLIETVYNTYSKYLNTVTNEFDYYKFFVERRV